MEITHHKPHIQLEEFAVAVREFEGYPDPDRLVCVVLRSKPPYDNEASREDHWTLTFHEAEALIAEIKNALKELK